MTNWYNKLTDSLADIIVGDNKTVNKVSNGVKGKINLLNEDNHVSREELLERLKVCVRCDHNKNNTCQLCGCPLDKAKLKESKKGICPANKWPILNN
jgi:DNA repair exonuclease SbcCD ATPase subunit